MNGGSSKTTVRTTRLLSARPSSITSACTTMLTMAGASPGTASQGILDAYYQPKFDNGTMKSLAALNAGVQLLVAQEGDNLPGLADDAPRLLRNYPDAPTGVVSTSLWISNFGDHNISSGSATLSWSLSGVAHNGTAVHVCNGSLVLNVTIPQGPAGLMPLSSLSCPLPDLGESPPPPPPPAPLPPRPQP